MKVVFNETCKECYFPKKRKCTNCIKENGKKIKDYIQHLEQKETILDKVTDKLKEDAREEEGYIKWLDERTKEIVQPKKTIIVKSDYARSILSIIEGEKEYCCNCGVELNNKNKALNNMCNECKYGLDY